MEFEQLASKKAKASMRVSVSAEVYGKFNEKGDFKPRVIPKSDSQIQRIKSRILNSFLFCNLDSQPLNIVIDAMEEKHFK
jgi:cAMP-dependent protein kinase regulator